MGRGGKYHQFIVPPVQGLQLGMLELALLDPATGSLERLPALAFAAPRTVAWGGLALLVVATLLYSQAGPRYSLMEALHERSEQEQGEQVG